MKIHDFSWVLARQKPQKSVDRIFHLQNDNLYYDKYWIKMVLETQRNIQNCAFKYFISKKLTFPPESCIHIFEDWAIVLVKKFYMNSTIRCAFKNAPGRFIGIVRRKYDQCSQICSKAQKEVEMNHLEKKKPKQRDLKISLLVE